MAIFMTGATGFLGRYIARALLEQGKEIVALTRGQDPKQAFERARQAVLDAPPLNHRVTLGNTDLHNQLHVCLGSLNKATLGLSRNDRESILSSCDQFIHCGATVSFNQSLAEARAVNVEGTKAMLDLASERMKRGALARFDHISTAYVAGKRTGLVNETELIHEAGHKNTYEQTKYEAEIEIRKWKQDLPLTVYRPSIIVGDSKSGHTNSFKMLYWPVKVYSHGIWRMIPGRPDTPIDLIPVDFVRDAFLAIRQCTDSIGNTYHLAAGPDGDLTLQETCDLITSFFPGRRPVKIFNPTIWMSFIHPILKRITRGRLRRILNAGEVYMPYFIQNPRFDTTQLKAALRETTVHIPDVKSYFSRIMHYCVDTDWGRKPLPQPHH